MRKFYSFLLALAIFASAQSQEGTSYWAQQSSSKVDNPRSLKINPSGELYFSLNKSMLWNELQNAPDRHGSSPNGVLIDIPTMDGIKQFSFYGASDMEDALQDKFQNIRSFVGVSADASGDRIRATWSPYGFYAMIHSFEHGTQFIDPIDRAGDAYMLYQKSELPSLGRGAFCQVMDEQLSVSNEGTTGVEDANDSELRTYRIAISTTVEYSTFSYFQAGLNNSSPDAARKNAVMTAIAVTLARVNSIYERDLAIQLILVGNNDQIVFLDTDNFSNNNSIALLSENQAIIDSVIGTANYDIGHVFSTGGGGVASFASVCSSSRKAQGVTGSPTPVGDPYDIDFVAHEIGHQFGASHSYNGTAANCGPQRSPTTAYEVGSGTTIMAYAGICPPQNVQPNSDAYFHQVSLDQIWSFVNGAGRCSTELPITNDPPTADAGADFIIPALTPYKLLGASTDPQGTSLHTYTWEQYDLGPAGLPNETNTSGPLVRSREGTNLPVRYVPQLEDVVDAGGVSTEWEVLSSVTRGINYRLTVRDNDARGGQTASDQMRLIVQSSAGPFTVTSQSTTGITWLPNTTETVTWNVANTNASPVNSSLVNILLSTDGGENFDHVLAANTPNDGSENITVPTGIVSIDCRIMVESADNVFFNVNSENFAVNATEQIVCNTYSSGAVNIGIPDSTVNGQPGAAIQDFINVPVTVVPDEVKISLDVTHSYNGDLAIEITNPSGVTSRIWNNNCLSARSTDIVATFEDGAAAIDCANPTSGPFASGRDALSDLANGNDANGNWRIIMADFFVGDTGILNSWTVELCTREVVPLSTPGVEADLFSIYPNPGNGQFTIESGAFAKEEVELRIYDLSGKLVAKESLFGGSQQNIDLRGKLSSGLYLLKLDGETNSSMHKLIIN